MHLFGMLSWASRISGALGNYAFREKEVVYAHSDSPYRRDVDDW